MKYQFKVPSIHCVSCTNTIETALLKNHPDISINASVLDKTITVDVANDQELDKILQTMKNIQYEAYDVHPLDHSFQASRQRSNNTHYQQSSARPFVLRAIVASLVGIPLFIVTLLNLTFSFYDLIAIAAVVIPITLIVGFNVYQNAWRALKNTQSITMDTLFAISTLITIVASVLSIALPTLGIPTMFEAGLMILGFRNIGLAIERKAKQKVLQDLSLLERLPGKARSVRRNDVGALIPQQYVAVSEIKSNQIIKVTAGETIPLDGIIIRGQATLQETIFSGELYPKSYGEGKAVCAGMEVLQGHVYINVKHPAQESLLVKINDKLSQAQTSKPKIEALMNQMIKYFIPVVILIAGISAAFMTYFFSPTLALQTSISVLCISCPCVFGFLVPLANKIAVSKAAMHGAFVTNPSILRSLSKLDTIVLDVTGTLTQPILSDVISYHDDWDLKKIVHYAATLEQHSDHVIATTLLKTNKQQHGNSLLSLESPTVARLGVTGTIHHKHYQIGDPRMMQENGIQLTPYQENISALQSVGKLPLLLVEDNNVIAIIALDQQLKPDALNTVKSLQQAGIQLQIATGSNHKTAMSVSKKLGLSEIAVHSEQTPQQKYELIVSLQKQNHKVAMIGDGGNDAIALAQSNVGMAIRSGDNLSHANASVILSDHSLKPVCHAIKVANQCTTNIYQNLVITFIYNTGALLLASGALITTFGIFINPAIAAAFMILETSFVLLNAARFKFQSVTESSKFSSSKQRDSSSTIKFSNQAVKLHKLSYSHALKHHHHHHNNVKKSDLPTKQPGNHLHRHSTDINNATDLFHGI